MRIFYVLLTLLIIATSAPYAGESDTSIPIGYYELCKRVPAPQECIADRNVTRAAPAIPYTAELFKTLVKVNYRWNKQIFSITDMELYGVEEYWAGASYAGDCEEFALAKRRTLLSLGFHPSQLLLTMVFDDSRLKHLVLVVRTTEGNFVLDNQKWEVALWGKMGYELVKHQNAQTPYFWHNTNLYTADTAARN